MKLFEWIYLHFFLIFLIWSPLSARKCCKVKVAQSQLGCINATTRETLTKTCDIQTTVNEIETRIDEIIAGTDCDTATQAIFNSDLPFTITEPGKYCVAEDLNPTAGTAITVQSSDVFIRMSGYTIDATGGGAIGIDVQVDFNNIVISQGAIRGASSFGIRLAGTDNVIIRSVLSEGNGGDGFLFSGSFNTCAQLIECTADGNTGNGFSDSGTTNIIFRNCVACSNTGDGFNLASNGFTIESSEAYGNSDGFECASASNGVIKDSVAANNSSRGIFASGTTTNVAICNNVSVNNTGRGILLATSGTTLTGTTTQCQVINNKVVSNGFGIDIGGGVFQPPNGGGVATARSHEIFGNFAKNNGSGTTENYSNDVIASPSTGPSPNGLISAPASGLGTLENVSS